MKKEPLYKQIFKDLKKKIEKGHYKIGEKLPYETELMDQYEVSRDTIRKAIRELKQIGFVHSIKGTGTFIKSQKITSYSLSGMLSYTQIMKENNMGSSSIVLSCKEIDLTGDNNNFFYNDERVYEVRRIRLADEEKMCYEITYISKSLCPNIIDFVTPNVSLFDLYENKFQISIGEGDFQFKASVPDEEVAKLLDIETSDPVLEMEADVLTASNAPLYYVKAYYIGDKYTFTTKLAR